MMLVVAGSKKLRMMSLGVLIQDVVKAEKKALKIMTMILVSSPSKQFSL